MKDRITCFKLNWYDCGLCCVEDTVQEEIIVYRNDNLLVFRELNGYGVICSCEIIHAKPDPIATFFAFLEKMNLSNRYKSPGRTRKTIARESSVPLPMNRPSCANRRLEEM